MAKKYTVSDGKLTLTLEEAEEGGFIVTSPLYPGLVTEAETVAECFVMAKDALAALRDAEKRIAVESRTTRTRRPAVAR